jgi:H+/Cl- antiporter ClcA
LIAVAIGIAAGFGSGLLTALVYRCEDAFSKLPIHWMWWPAIGAVFVGVGGWIDPRVLGVGYDIIDGLLRGEILGAALIGLLIGKSLVWSIALGSGTFGGVLAPLALGAGLGICSSLNAEKEAARFSELYSNYGSWQERRGASRSCRGK